MDRWIHTLVDDPESYASLIELAIAWQDEQLRAEAELAQVETLERMWRK